MYVYRIVEEEINEEMEDGFATDFSYVTHEQKFSEVEFEDMCKKAITMSEEKTVYSFYLIKILCSEFGFEKLNPVASFQYTIE
ncbi:hypothetical protein BAOM_3045 [Peribacillus asahii]|uniref:Uncharacterized protein n=1 Tax=Peribacillus asahii TaxID=228899 RepID=A0A3Q9RPB3_9BACI|nr:hypothetical protein [Peribacillus asahii]AZV43654.1 hypothetical protein BAOM_3045 [Peribacillus asahii]